jgi:S1-C subfamily serine protease
VPALRDLYLKYRPCIVRISVVSAAGDLRTGTGFHIGDGLVVTARHVIRETVKKPDIIGEVEVEVDRKLQAVIREVDQKILTVTKINYHPDLKVDLAVLETDFEAHAFLNEFGPERIHRARSTSIPLGSHVDGWISDQFTLCKVLVMGYPTVPWTSSVLVTTEGEINALVQNVRVPHPYFVVSSTARGGFSGAPVISDTGVVIGIIVEALYGDYKPEETGFNAAITIEPLIRILVDRGIRPSWIASDIWTKFLKS